MTTQSLLDCHNGHHAYCKSVIEEFKNILTSEDLTNSLTIVTLSRNVAERLNSSPNPPQYLVGRTAEEQVEEVQNRLPDFISSHLCEIQYVQYKTHNPGSIIYVDCVGNTKGPGSCEVKNQSLNLTEWTDKTASQVVSTVNGRGYRFASRNYRRVCNHQEAVRFIRSHFRNIHRRHN